MILYVIFFYCKHFYRKSDDLQKEGEKNLSSRRKDMFQTKVSPS